MALTKADQLIFPLVLVVGVLFGSFQVASMPGVPMHGRYHPSDMDDLQEQLLGRSVLPKPYAASSDHPAWLAFCGFYRVASNAFGMSGMRLWHIVTPLMLGLNLCLFLGVARQLRFDRVQALGLTAVLLATGATVTWSVVLETHVLAPTSLLLAVLVLTNRRFTSGLWKRPTSTSVLAYGGAISLAASITITNIMLAVLAVIPVNPLRHPDPVRLATGTFRRIPTLAAGFLVGIGILAFVHLAGWYLIQDREMRQFLEVLVKGAGDVSLLLQGIPGSRWESILAVAWIAPPMDAYQGSPEALDLLALERGPWTAPAYLSGFVVLLLTIWSLRVVPARMMFIPGFIVMGIVLHSFYGLGESFLFSANYTWASVLSLGLLGRAVAPRRIAVSAWSLAPALLVLNLFIWSHGIRWIAENGYVLPAVN